MSRMRQRTIAAMLVAACALGAGCAAPETSQTPADVVPADAAPVDPALEGALDIHAHVDPDGFGPGGSGRLLDAVDLARLADEAGLRGFVIKQHYDQTADSAYLVRKQYPGLEVFGGIGLNLTVGGLNVHAVRQMIDVKGGWGRIVWMPTWDAEYYVTEEGGDRPFITVARDGELVPEARAIIAAMADGRIIRFLQQRRDAADSAAV